MNHKTNMAADGVTRREVRAYFIAGGTALLTSHLHALSAMFSNPRRGESASNISIHCRIFLLVNRIRVVQLGVIVASSFYSVQMAFPEPVQTCVYFLFYLPLLPVSAGN